MADQPGRCPPNTNFVNMILIKYVKAKNEVKKPANNDSLSGLSEKGIKEISKNWEYIFLLKTEKFDVPAYRFSLR